MAMVSFTDACSRAAEEFNLQRERAENKYLFDKAVDWMERMKYRADIKRGIVRDEDGVVKRFAEYDWSHQYEENPHHVFYDFFLGDLLNKYGRLLRGVDQ